ncbi:serine hydrolase domain-containing protein [Brucella cytisi]|uniref:serine hydrolase domain-containing protein n=1 Tax=Brucella cytisi TaxID=407152 RepID=UPI0035D614C5
MNSFNFSPAHATEAGFAIEPLQELCSFLRTTVGNGNLPGAVIFLARGNKVVLHEAIGYADVESGRPVRSSDIFRLHSMTKPFTAVAMLVLYEEGKWEFEEPVSHYLPEFRDFATKPGNRASREPVIRELFTHSSGHGFGETFEEIIATAIELDILGSSSLSDLIRRYAQMPLRYEPGTRWEYSFAVDLQAAIVERISGMRYDRFLERYIFEPLGMHDTGFTLSDDQRVRLVPGYALDSDNGRLRPANTIETQDIIIPIGGSSFHSTSGDYARFIRMLLNRGSLGASRILRPESVDLMLNNLVPIELLNSSYSATHYVVGGGNGFGMNGMVCMDPAAAHRPVGRGTYEWGGAHGPWFWADPENDILFVGMTNRVLPYPEFEPLSLLSQKLVYRALKR